MKQIQKIAVMACLGMLVLCGCSMSRNNEESSLSKANEMEANPPQNNRSANSETMENMLSYLNGNGIQLDQMKTLDQMDFAAHEGRSFTYQGNTGYLYRLKSEDENMKALLDSAKNNGTIKVNIDGKEQDYNASVNGDYLFVYQQDADMSDFVTVFGQYIPNLSTLPNGVDTNGNLPDQNTTNDDSPTADEAMD